MHPIRLDSTTMALGDHAGPVRRRMRNVYLLVGLAVACAWTGSSEAGPNLVVNGDFSTGNTGFFSQYTFVASGPTIAGQYSIVTDPGVDLANGDASFGDHTTGTGSMFFGDGGLTSRVAYSQTIAVVPGLVYDVSFWIANTNGLASPTLRLIADGVLIATRTPAAIAGAWEQVTATFVATNPIVDLRLLNIASGSTLGRNFVLDDISLSTQGGGNQPPVFDALPDRAVDELTTLTFQVTATDDQTPSSSLTFAIDYDSTTANAAISSSGMFSYSPSESEGPGDYLVRVIVRDDGTPQSFSAASFTVHVREVNSPPILNAIGCLRGTEHHALAFVAHAQDLDFPANTLTYSLDPGAPAGATIDPASGAFSWTPGETQGPGTHTITVRVTDDGTPPMDAAETVAIEVPESPDGTNLLVNGHFEEGFTGFASDYTFRAGGSISNFGDFTVADGTAGGGLSFADHTTCTGKMLFALGPSFPPTLWSQTVPVTPRRRYALSLWAALPSSLSGPNRLTILVNGTPVPGSFDLPGPTGDWQNLVATFTSGQETSLTVSIQLSGRAALDDLVMTDIGPANSPVLATIADFVHDEMSPLAFAATASDLDAGQTLTYALAPGAPAGAAITPTGQFSWTPNEAQGPADHPVTVIVTDDGVLPLSDEQTFVVHVREANLPPVLTIPGCGRGLEGAPLALAVTATDPDLPANVLTYSLDPGAPAGMTIDSGTGVISWIPGASSSGLHTVTIRLQDSATPPLTDVETLVVDVADTEGGGPNLVVNGDFESGAVGFTSEYTYINGGFSRPTEHSVVTNPSTTFTNGFFDLTDHTTCHGLMLFADGGPSTLEIWAQEIPVVPGTTYVFSYWARPAVGPNPAVLRVTVDGVTVGTDLGLSEAAGWLLYRGTFTPSAGASVHVAIQDVNPDPLSLGNDLVIDDIAMRTLAQSNRPPVVSIVGPAAGALFTVNAPVVLRGTYSDPDAGDSHVAQWFIDDVPYGPSAAVSGDSASFSTTFTTAGVYALRLRVTDQGGLFGDATQVADMQALIVVYDPNGGFVTGGGWMQSPAGALASAPTAVGKATFGFVSKYQKGATLPTGETEFNFKTANFKFASTSYEWLVVGQSKAQYKGAGMVNGTSGYRFMLTAIDGELQGNSGLDRIRLRVWSSVTGAPVYDNQHGAADDEDPVTALGGGSVVIHKGGNSKPSETAGSGALLQPALALRIHGIRPNPVQGSASLALDLPESGGIEASVFDVTGRRVSGTPRTELDAGSHSIRWDARNEQGESLAAGLYYLRVRVTLTNSGRAVFETRKLFVTR